MRIPIDTIPKDGLDIELQLQDSWARDVAATVLEAPAAALEGSLLIELRERSVRVRGQVRAAGQRTCERCGEATELVLDTEDFDLSYVPRGDAPTGHGEVRLGAGDLDLGWYDGGVIELADVVSEALALSLPPRIVCSDRAACDARVNDLLASAGEAGAKSPFAALRDLI